MDGNVGLILAPGGKLVSALRFTIANGRIMRAEVIGEPEHLHDLELALFE